MYVVVYRDQNAEKSQNINIDNKSFERMEHFRQRGNNPNESKFHLGRN